MAINGTGLEGLRHAQAIGIFKAIKTGNVTLQVCRRLKRNWKRTFAGEWPVLEKIRIGETARNIFEVGAHEIE